MSKEQTFLAEYRWKNPFGERSTYAVIGGVRHLVATKASEDYKGPLIEWMKQKGAEIVVVVEVEGREDAARFDEARLAMNKVAGQKPADEQAWILENCAMVSTPSRLGREVHMERQRVVEEFLRSFGIEFTLECSRKYSDGACRPVTRGPLKEKQGPVEPTA